MTVKFRKSKKSNGKAKCKEDSSKKKEWQHDVEIKNGELTTKEIAKKGEQRQQDRFKRKWRLKGCEETTQNKDKKVRGQEKILKIRDKKRQSKKINKVAVRNDRGEK